MSDRPMSDRNDRPTAGIAGIPNAFLPGDWFFEFEQDYGDGIRVIKRGLDASLLVVRKYDIGAEEVLAAAAITWRPTARAMTSRARSRAIWKRSAPGVRPPSGGGSPRRAAP